MNILLKGLKTRPIAILLPHQAQQLLHQLTKEKSLR